MAEREVSRGPRYGRRVIALGGVVLLAAYVIGAPTFNDRIEADLTERVPDELADAGFVGVSATFDGQDGRLTCNQPLSDPEAAVDAAYDVWGVRQIELDQGCRVRSAEIADSDAEVDADADPDADPDAAVPDADSTDDGTVQAGDGASTTTGSVVDFDTVADIISGSPELSLLATLKPPADLAELGADGDVTVFAPSDAAFDQLAADTLAELRDDEDLLGAAIAHHVVQGRLLADDLVSGTLTAMSGDELEVVAGANGIRIDGALITAADMVAANGVVHVVDQVLLPTGLALQASADPAALTATFEDGTVDIAGVVATEVERVTLTDAAESSLGSAAVGDSLTVDPNLGAGPEIVDDLAALIVALTSGLVGGVAGHDGENLYITGRYADDSQRDAVLATAASVGATTDLVPRPAASETDAADLERELNEYAAANPILFEPGSAVLTASAATVIDNIARQLRQFDGVTVTIEGHTDSDGSPDANLVLSQARAGAVVDALVARGFPDAIFTARGFGSEQPILVDGVEDKAASRRVEFRVEPTA